MTNLFLKFLESPALTEQFLQTLNMSLSATWLVLAVITLRFLLKKAPKWIHVLLWGLVAFRLVCPFTLESALSLIPSAQVVPPEIMMDPTPTIHTGVESLNRVVNPIINETFAPEPIASANPLQILIPVAASLWLLGMGLMLLYTAVSYLRLHRRVSMAIRVKENIYLSEFVSSPFVLGLFRPKIYLPYHMNESDRRHVIAHERAHIARRDHWWKPFGFLLLTLHWFNPLMWLAYILLCRDIELACDERVIKQLGTDQRADYSQALLHCSIPHRSIAACPLAFGEVGVRKRVKNVLNYKEPAFWVILISLILCIIAAVFFLTNPIEESLTDQVVNQKGYRITSQEEKKINLVIWKEWLPQDCFTERGHTFREKERIPYAANASNTLYLKHVCYDDDTREYLRFTFDFAPSRSENGKLLLPYHVNIENGVTKDLSMRCAVVRGEVWSSNGTYPDAAYIRSTDPGETFAVYIKSEVYEQTNKHIAFMLSGFNELTYEEGEITSPFGHTYRAVEISVRLFHADFRYTGDMPSYELTSDEMLKIKFNADSEHLQETGTFDSITLDEENFDRYFPASDQWVGISAGELRQKNARAWRLLTEPETTNADFYYLLQQEDGSLYITQGHYDQNYVNPEDEQTGIDYVFKLKQDDSLSSSHSKVQPLLGKTFHVSQVLYAHPSFSSTWLQIGIPFYSVTENCILLTRDALPITAPTDPPAPWIEAGQFEILELSQDNFDRYFWDEDSSKTFRDIRRNNQQTWRVITTNDTLYYLLRQENGDLYLAYGTYDPEGERDWASDDTTIRFLVQLTVSPENDWAVAMTPHSISRNSAFLSFRQVGAVADGMLSYGDDYSIEQEVDGVWQELPHDPEKKVFATIAHVIESDSHAYDQFDWTEIYGTLSDGHYRIRKTVTLSRAPGDSESRDYYAEFTIGGSAEDSVFLSVEDVTPTGLTVRETVFASNAADVVVDHFYLEAFQNGQWAYLEPTEQIEPIFNGVKRNIPTSHIVSTGAMELDWSSLYGQLPPGTYRIARDYTFYDGLDVSIRTAYAEFTTSDIADIALFVDRIRDDGISVSFLLGDSVKQGEYFFAGAGLQYKEHGIWQDIFPLPERLLSDAQDLFHSQFGADSGFSFLFGSGHHTLRDTQYRVCICIRQECSDGSTKYHTLYEYFNPTDYAWGMSMTIRDFSSTGVTLDLYNNKLLPTTALSYSRGWKIQQRKNNQWVDLETQPDTSDYPTEPIPATQITEHIRWNTPLPNGTYRLVKDIHRHYGTGDTDTRQIYGVFVVNTIPEGHLALGTATLQDTPPVAANLLYKGECIAALADDSTLPQLYDMFRNALPTQPPDEDIPFDLEVSFTMEDGTTRCVQATILDDLYRIEDAYYDYGPDDARESLFRHFGLTWTDPEILALLRHRTSTDDAERLHQVFSLLQDPPDDYTLEQATEDGVVVLLDGDIYSNENVWQNFLTQTQQGKPATVRTMEYYSPPNPDRYASDLYESIKDTYPQVYIFDIRFNGESYSLRTCDYEEEYQKDYQYLRHFTGDLPSSATFKTYDQYILTNDNTSPWEEIIFSAASSQLGAYIDHHVVYSDYNG
ncbi:MAG: hypothetical protein IJD98_00260 [Oscillospiraceae bacterium]|nr:hypothetical protein [Oscillospiraceae bacterium]